MFIHFTTESIRIKLDGPGSFSFFIQHPSPPCCRCRRFYLSFPAGSSSALAVLIFAHQIASYSWKCCLLPRKLEVIENASLIQFSSLWLANCPLPVSFLDLFPSVLQQFRIRCGRTNAPPQNMFEQLAARSRLLACVVPSYVPHSGAKNYHLNYFHFLATHIFTIRR